MVKSKFITLLILCFSISLQAQDIIKLQNPSFEDIPRHSKAPRGWFNCGMDGETPPDVQPGFFEVNQPAQDGATYLGLVTRDNETWEAVGQRLKTPFVSGRCYQFRIYLSYSDEYFSQSKTTQKNEFFIKPVKLRVWGGNGYCDKRSLLGETEIVNSTEWKEYQVTLKPKQNFKYIVFEAFYKTPTLFPYNGNLLLDNASSIVMKDQCDDEWKEDIMPEPINRPIASNDKPKVNRPKPKKKPKKKPKVRIEEETYTNDVITEPSQDAVVNNKPVTTNPSVPNTVVPAVKPKPQEKPKVIKPKTYITPEFKDINKLRIGQTIRIQNVGFAADDDKILNASRPSLDELVNVLKKHPKLKIEIQGHTNTIPSEEYCNWLSDKRAKSIATYILSKGITSDRIPHKGYGKSNPVDLSKTIEGRRKNQRIEIKILEI